MGYYTISLGGIASFSLIHRSVELPSSIWSATNPSFLSLVATLVISELSKWITTAPIEKQWGICSSALGKMHPLGSSGRIFLRAAAESEVLRRLIREEIRAAVHWKSRRLNVLKNGAYEKRINFPARGHNRAVHNVRRFYSCQ